MVCSIVRALSRSKIRFGLPNCLPCFRARNEINSEMMKRFERA
jgi:hypothetical protein